MLKLVLQKILNTDSSYVITLTQTQHQLDRGRAEQAARAGQILPYY